MPTASVSVISISSEDKNFWMYLPVTSLCCSTEGSGEVKSHNLGISALTEAAFSFPNVFQSDMLRMAPGKRNMICNIFRYLFQKLSRT